MTNSDQPCIAKPELLYCTVNGGIGVIATLDQKHFEMLEDLELAMANVLSHPGSLPHKEYLHLTRWREFRNERTRKAAFNFIDGDLVEMFLELPRSKQNTVVEGMQVQFKVEELCRVLEDIQRVH